MSDTMVTLARWIQLTDSNKDIVSTCYMGGCYRASVTINVTPASGALEFSTLLICSV